MSLPHMKFYRFHPTTETTAFIPQSHSSFSIISLHLQMALPNFGFLLLSLHELSSICFKKVKCLSRITQTKKPLPFCWAIANFFWSLAKRLISCGPRVALWDIKISTKGYQMPVLFLFVYLYWEDQKILIGLLKNSA